MSEKPATVVVASASLARRLREDHARRQIADGLDIWASPDIVPYDAWLRRSWRELSFLVDLPLLLSTVQAEGLWSRIVGESGLVDSLMRGSEAAIQAADAWKTTRAFCIDPAAHWYSESADVRAYQRWEHAFRRRCEANGWIDAASLAGLLAEQPAFKPHKPLLLCGFDRPTPQQRRLFDALAARGIAIDAARENVAGSSVAVTALADPASELRACARWAARALDVDPAASIGVVIPGLHAQRSEVRSIFADAFADRAESATFDLWQPASLGDAPVIAAAFAALHLFTSQVRLEQAGVLLASPCFRGYPEEREARAAIFDRLGENGEAELAPPDLVDWLARVASAETTAECPLFVSAMQRALDTIRETPQRNAPSQWTQRFARLLRALGWADGWARGRDEQALLTRWQDLLGEFAALDRVWAKVDAHTALARLQRQARSARLVPEPLAAPVRIMSPADADGQAFDALWVARLDDQTWPPAARPSPFIPLSLQREAGVTAASSERQHEHYQALTARLSAAAPEVVFSHATSAGELLLQPSPVLANYPRAAAPKTAMPGVRERVFAGRRLETLPDCEGSSLSGDQRVAGGASLVRDQAACPFRAYARYRLQARGAEACGIGVEPVERGSAAHRALEHLWGKLKTQDALLALDEAGVKELVDEVVEGATVRRLARGVGDRRAFVGVERERLRAALSSWLAVERNRPRFSVLEREADLTVEVAGLELRLRLDRIDEDSSGHRLLIDYKTGAIDTRGWQGERPDDPQLPMYAVFAANVDGVLFARLHPEQAEIKGWSRRDLAVPGCTALDDWDAQLEEWRRTLSALVEEFKSGLAPVAPKNRRQTCKYCDLSALCRICERGPERRDG